MLFWLQFRLKQVFRAVRAAGWGLLLALLLCSVGLWLPALVAVLDAPDWVFVPLLHLALAWLHTQRRDAAFLQQSKWPAWQTLLCDYALIVFPICLVLALIGRFWAILGVSLAVLWAFAPMPKPWKAEKVALHLPLRWVPIRAYEWLYIIRTQWFFLLLGLVLQLASVFHYGFFIAGSFVVLFLVATGFEHLGPADLQPRGLSDFVQRWRLQAMVLHGFLAIGYAALLIFHLEYWFLALYVAIAAEAFLLQAFAGKVLAWQPERRRVYGETIMSIMLILCLIPGGALIVLAWALFRLWRVCSI